MTAQTVEPVTSVPTVDEARFAAAELRTVLRDLGPGRVTFYRDGSSLWHDMESRDRIRERIALLDVYAGQVAPLIPEDADNGQVNEPVSYCDKGPCGALIDHDGECVR